MKFRPFRCMVTTRNLSVVGHAGCEARKAPREAFLKRTKQSLNFFSETRIFRRPRASSYVQAGQKHREVNAMELWPTVHDDLFWQSPMPPCAISNRHGA